MPVFSKQDELAPKLQKLAEAVKELPEAHVLRHIWSGEFEQLKRCTTGDIVGAETGSVVWNSRRHDWDLDLLNDVVRLGQGLEKEDECPNCKNGTLGLEEGSLVCRGECGEFFEVTELPK